MAERWRELGLIDATDEGAGFIIGVPGPIAEERKPTSTEEPVYGMWERYSRDNDGNLDIKMVPTRWLPGEAWALINGAWKQVDSAEVGNEARMLAKAAYEDFFGTLIALPAAAFSAQRD